LDAVGLCHNFGERNSEYTAHSLRHTLACTMLAAGATEADVSLMLRHASPATTRQYIYHVDTMRRIESAKKYDVMDLYKR
jgi:integrase